MITVESAFFGEIKVLRKKYIKDDEAALISERVRTARRSGLLSSLLNSIPSEGINSMEEENLNLTWEIRVSEGRAGTDPEAPDWEVAELENGVVKNNADIYDNLTYAEAQQIAGMWTKKKEDAEAS